MKKIIFIVVLLFQLTLFVNAKSDSEYYEIENIVSTNTKYYKTVTLSSNTNISTMSLFDSYLTNTVEVTEEEYNGSIFANDAQSSSYQTTYKKMTVNIIKSGSKYKYENILEWKNMPVVRSYDIIGIGYYASVKVSSINFENYYCLNNGNCIKSSNFSLVNSNNGVGAVFQLPTSNDLSSLKITFSLIIDKNVSATIKELYAIGDYSHAVKTLSLNSAKNFSVSSANGISLNNSIKDYYDEIPAVTTTTSCNW